MACKYICDGCGKEESAELSRHNWAKPDKWFQRGDMDGIQDACSRQCIEKVAENSGKTKVVLPF